MDNFFECESIKLKIDDFEWNFFNFKTFIDIADAFTAFIVLFLKCCNFLRQCFTVVKRSVCVRNCLDLHKNVTCCYRYN